MEGEVVRGGDSERKVRSGSISGVTIRGNSREEEKGRRGRGRKRRREGKEGKRGKL